MHRFSFGDIHAVDVRGARLYSKEFSDERMRQDVLRILDSNLLCSMATVTPVGDAHINTAYFSYSDTLQIYFWSHLESLHCRNVSNNGSMAMTIFSTVQPWSSPGQGVQLFGTCETISGSSADEAERSYGARFEGYDDWKATLKDDNLARQYRFYRFNAAEVKLLDEKNLGDGVFVRASIRRH